MKLTLIPLLFLSLHANAEVLKDSLMFKPEGGNSSCIRLNKGIKVSISVSQSKPVLSVAGYVEPTAFKGTNTVKANSFVFDKHNKEIGYIVSECAFAVTGKTNGKFKEIAITGPTSLLLIEQSSLIENHAKEILERNNYLLTKVSFDSFKMAFGARLQEHDHDIKSVTVMEDLVNEPSPDPRITLLFYKNVLVAVIHLLPVSYPKFTHTEKVDRFKVTFKEKLDPAVRKNIQSIFYQGLKTSG